MFEQERKSGQLSVTREHLVAFIDVVEGRVVRARSNEIDASSHDIMMSILDWKDGYFEVLSGGPAQIKPELDSSITHLLLDHARLRDEETRR